MKKNYKLKATIGSFISLIAISTGALAACIHLGASNNNCITSCTDCLTANPNGATACACERYSAAVTWDCKPDVNPTYPWWPLLNVGKAIVTGTCAGGICTGVQGPVTRVDLYPAGDVDCNYGS